MPYTGDLPCVQRLAERYPEVSWLVAHSGKSWGYAVSVADLIQKHRNVYAEITYTAVTNRSLEYFVDQGLEDHVLFGTDAPMRDPRQQLGWVLWADLPVAVRQKMLQGNFQRILDRAKIASRKERLGG
jgi:predicted TIM-barrel fold metal-dependent hydrolase